MPPPNRRGREPTEGMAPPEHRPLGAAGSSGGAVMPQPPLRGKGTGSSGGSRGKAAAAGIGSSGVSTEKAAGAGIGSTVATPLANLSNLFGTPGFRRKESSTNPSPAATTQPRVATGTKYTRPWSSSSPRGPSLRTGQQLRPTKSYRRRFSLLSINGVDSLTSADADGSASHLCNTVADGSGSHSSNTADGNFREPAARIGPVEKPGAGLSGLIPPSPSLAVKARMALSLETPASHWGVTNLNVEAQQEHQSVTGSNVETPRKHQAVKGSSGGTPRKHQAITGSSGGMPRKHQAVTVSSGGTPRKHQAAKGSNEETTQGSQGHEAVTVSNGATAQKHRIKEKVGGGSSEQNMAPKIYRKERTRPSLQVCHTSGIQRAGTNTKLPTAREKQQSKSNPSFPRDSTLHTDRKLKRTSSKDARAGLSLGGNSTAHHGEELTDDEKRRLTKEMMIKAQEADLLIHQLNELGVGEDINQEELQCYYEQLPCEPPHVDTSLELDDEQIKKLRVHHVLCRIKYYKVTQQGRKDDPHDTELEDDYHLCCLKEKLKCFVEDETKLDEDNILDCLDKEGLLGYIEEDVVFDWSFQYLTVAALDNYQRLVPQNGGGCEYVHWDDYRGYFHKYEIELEYLDFWEELSKKLKWMEDYIHFGWPTLKWRRICSRGESQAIKIATGFSNITVRLAHAAYYECIDDINMEYCWYKELDGVYFEIWKRVTKLKSFREALDEVYKLDKFPLRQHVMKYALESNGCELEMEFHNCTKGISEEITEEKAHDLIAEAITKLRTRPKFYAQYIRKKIEIARAIGIIPPV
ncbi:unnamed protein product [Urochloa decumbens]|uniref:Uncharacterized protein n=1 Tax=Urochloa decumbens TaxID=240449 RepID=A0ABC8VU07_9POAL